MIKRALGVASMLIAAGIAIAWLLCGWTVPMPKGWTDADTLTLVMIVAWLHTGSQLGGDHG